MTKRGMRLGVIVVTGLLAGCGHVPRIAADHDHVPALVGRRHLIDGRALIVMSAEDAAWVYEGPPVGSRLAMASKVQFEVGEITRQAALEIFGRSFSQGAECRPTAEGATGFAVIVKPKVDKFTYKWIRDEQESSIVLDLVWGALVQSWLEMEMHVVCQIPGGRLLLDKTYASGPVAGGRVGYQNTHRASVKAHLDELSRMFHRTVTVLLAHAAQDLPPRDR